jgi:8-oxo-dGTP diphosphatase
MPFLIRHASAGDRDGWIGDDRARPLDDQGRRQAAALVEVLADRPISRVLTSAYLRCVETMEPLAQARRLPLEYRHELGDEAGPEDALLLLRELDRDVALCSHGDLIRALLGEELEKGEGAVIEVTDESVVLQERLRPASS